MFLFIIFSCDEESFISENFVVEAFLFQGESIDDIKITKAKMYNSSDTTEEVISNASVKILFNGSEYELDYDVLSEKHVMKNSTLDIISGKQYGLEVTVKERTATAETVVPTKPVGLTLSNDKIVIPDESRKYFSEKIIYLPDSYYPTYNERKVSTIKFYRREYNITFRDTIIF